MGIAHITGGGFIENIPRIFPKGVGCEVWLRSYEVPPVFKLMQEKAGISDEQIYNTFNMGIGMVVCVAKRDVDKTLAILRSTGEECCVIGKATRGSGVKLIK